MNLSSLPYAVIGFLVVCLIGLSMFCRIQSAKLDTASEKLKATISTYQGKIDNIKIQAQSDLEAQISINKSNTIIYAQALKRIQNAPRIADSADCDTAFKWGIIQMQGMK